MLEIGLQKIGQKKADCYYNMTCPSKTSVHFDLNWNYFGTKSSATKNILILCMIIFFSKTKKD